MDVTENLFLFDLPDRTCLTIVDVLNSYPRLLSRFRRKGKLSSAWKPLEIRSPWGDIRVTEHLVADNFARYHVLVALTTAVTNPSAAALGVEIKAGSVQANAVMTMAATIARNFVLNDGSQSIVLRMDRGTDD